MSAMRLVKWSLRDGRRVTVVVACKHGTKEVSADGHVVQIKVKPEIVERLYLSGRDSRDPIHDCSLWIGGTKVVGRSGEVAITEPTMALIRRAREDVETMAAEMYGYRKYVPAADDDRVERAMTLNGGTY